LRSCVSLSREGPARERAGVRVIKWISLARTGKSEIKFIALTPSLALSRPL
jgi:hypothetical protein